MPATQCYSRRIGCLQAEDYSWETLWSSYGREFPVTKLSDELTLVGVRFCSTSMLQDRLNLIQTFPE